MKAKGYSTSFTVDQSPQDVFDAVNNVRGWWSEELDGRTDKLGAEFKFQHKDIHRSTQKITELVPRKKVVWHVLDGHLGFVKDKAEWKGTDVVFEISKKDDKTELRFTHVGLVPAIECYGDCSGAWGFFINDSLRSLITTGRGKPIQKEKGTEKEVTMTSITSPEKGRKEGQHAMNTPPIVSPQEWEAARQQLLVKEKALTRSRDALAAERRRMPWLAVEKKYEFDGPKGKVSLLALFEGRRQLIIYRAFFEPEVFGWPEHACRGCSLGADQVAHLAHLNARDTTLAYASRAPQKDIERVKARMGWKMPWYTITDSFDTDFGVGQWHGHNVFFRDGEHVFRTYFINGRGDEAMGTTWSYLDATPLGRQETWEDSPQGYPQAPPYKWWNWHDNYAAEASPDPRWVDITTDPQGAALRRREAEEKDAPAHKRDIST